MRQRLGRPTGFPLSDDWGAANRSQPPPWPGGSVSWGLGPPILIGQIGLDELHRQERWEWQPAAADRFCDTWHSAATHQPFGRWQWLCRWTIAPLQLLLDPLEQNPGHPAAGQ